MSNAEDQYRRLRDNLPPDMRELMDQSILGRSFQNSETRSSTSDPGVMYGTSGMSGLPTGFEHLASIGEDAPTPMPMSRPDVPLTVEEAALPSIESPVPTETNMTSRARRARATAPSAPESEDTTEFRNRFKDAPWFRKAKQDIVLAGVGGIGSWTALLLARMGATLTVYDPDTFDPSNISGQLVPTKNIGMQKVQSVAAICKDFADNDAVNCMARRWEEGEMISKVSICGFDNMTARKAFYEGWKAFVGQLPEAERAECLFIDGRLAAEAYQVLSIRGSDISAMEMYERDYLFSDDEADETQCSYKQTSHMAAQIAGKMVEYYAAHCNNISSGTIPRAIPFFYEYDAVTGAQERKI